LELRPDRTSHSIDEFTLMNPISVLEELVNISSSSKNITGVNTAQSFVAKKLKKLGFSIKFIENPLGISAPLVIAKKAGSAEETTTFICHTDTVNCPERYPFSIDTELGKVFGAGVADDKGGVVVGLCAVEKYLALNPKHKTNIQFVISPNEELGSIGFHDIFKRIGAESHYLLGLEPADSKGRIIHARNGNRWYKVSIKGKSAHSGRFGESYVNATHELAGLISAMIPFNNEAEKTRVNFGAIKTLEKSYNTICSEVEVKLDIRFATFGVRDKLHKKLEDYVSHPKQSCPYTDLKSEISFEIVDDCPSLEESQKNKDFAKNFIQFVEKEEKSVVESIHSGGAADINYMSNPTNIGIDGLGPIGANLHTNQEFIYLDSLKTRSNAIYNFLVSLN